jgi:isopenicillin N synthase-like dioxygenase
VIRRDRSACVSEQIPLLDLGSCLAGAPGALGDAAQQLRHACQEVGFFYVRGHGVEQGLIDRVFEQAARFHALPLERKLKIRINDNVVGYLPFQGGISRNARVTGNTKPNLNESFFMRHDLPADDPEVVAGKPFRCLNQWPDDLPGFRAALVEYFNALEMLAQSMLPLYAAALELPADYFGNFFDKAQATLRLAHYPPQPAPEDGVFGSAPHSDGGFMTLLAQARVPGLEIRTVAGDWIPAPVIPGTFLVNSGDLMARWTNDRWLSTLHRVANPPDEAKGGSRRLSIVFFHHANYDATVSCLPTCVAPGSMPKYETITVSDYYRMKKSQQLAARPRAMEAAAS